MQPITRGPDESEVYVRSRRSTIFNLLIFIAATAFALAAISRPSWVMANATSIGPRLITTTIIDCVYPYLPSLLGRSQSDPNHPWQQWAATPPGAGSMYDRLGMYMKTSPAFLLIGHSLFAALAAVGGGFLAVRFYATRR
jgi:hypothetical protein